MSAISPTDSGRHFPTVRISFSPDLPGQICAVADSLALHVGESYVVTCSEGERVGRLARFELPLLRPCGERSAGSVSRRATPKEVERGQQLSEIEREALLYCRHRAVELNLPMRPVFALAPLDRDVLIIAFAAEERIDFRELLRDLSRRMRRRVELRQVGVRDQAKLSGGWGPCGRVLCCATFMARFASVTIRMAKAQRLSLNPTRISGMCGRLMCCLAHEDANPKGSQTTRPEPETPSPQNT